MRLEELQGDTKCTSLDYLVLCEEEKVRRLERVEGRWVVVRLSWCSTEQFSAPSTARLLRSSEIPFGLRFELHDVSDKELSAHVFARYRLAEDLSQMVPV